MGDQWGGRAGPGAWSKLMKAESTGQGQAPAGYLLASTGRTGATAGGALMPCQRTWAQYKCDQGEPLRLEKGNPMVKHGRQAT